MIKTTVEVNGMMCGMCESHVNEAVRKNFTVKKVQSSHTKGKTEILSEEALDQKKFPQKCAKPALCTPRIALAILVDVPLLQELFPIPKKDCHTKLCDSLFAIL